MSAVNTRRPRFSGAAPEWATNRTGSAVPDVLFILFLTAPTSCLRKIVQQFGKSLKCALECFSIVDGLVYEEGR